MSLESLTEALKTRIGAGGSFGRSVKFDFPGEGVIRIDDRASPARIDNEDADTECTIRLSIDDFKDIASGKKSAQSAYLLGKIKIEGDLSVAFHLSSILG